METGKSVRDIVLENKYLTEMEANIILDLHKMTTCINGEELLYRKKTKKEE